MRFGVRQLSVRWHSWRWRVVVLRSGCQTRGAGWHRGAARWRDAPKSGLLRDHYVFGEGPGRTNPRARADQIGVDGVETFRAPSRQASGRRPSAAPGVDGASAPPARATRPRGIDAWLDAPRGGNDLGRSAVRRIHRPRTGHVLVAAPAGYFAAFFLRSAQEAVIRSETAFFSSAVIGRRFLVGLASDAVSATGVAAAAGRREEERRAAGFAGAEVPSILSTSFNALISPCKRSISLWRVGDCLCYDTHKFSQGLYRPSLDALWAPAPGAFQWVAILDTRTPMALRSPGGSSVWSRLGG